MAYSELEKKQLKIYLLIAYLIPYLCGILMWVCYRKGLDVSVFPNAQMYYPAAGVILAVLVTRSEDPMIPRRFYIFYLLVTLVLMALSVASALIPGMSWSLLAQQLIIVGSVVGWIFLLTEKKEKRAAYGLTASHGKASVWCVLLFFLLYLARTVLAHLLSGTLSSFAALSQEPMVWISVLVLPVNFFLVFLAFFGEEYGWRYYLQPLLQKRFGAAKGVILLGIVWGLWHLPINFLYYSPAAGLVSAAGQQITCITLGIFFAYAYMKTGNIWVPVILHFLNNNLIPIISGVFSADVLQNQQIRWADLPIALLLNGLVFGCFLLTKNFRKSGTRLPTINERADSLQ